MRDEHAFCRRCHVCGHQALDVAVQLGQQRWVGTRFFVDRNQRVRRRCQERVVQPHFRRRPRLATETVQEILPCADSGLCPRPSKRTVTAACRRVLARLPQMRFHAQLIIGTAQVSQDCLDRAGDPFGPLPGKVQCLPALAQRLDRTVVANVLRQWPQPRAQPSRATGRELVQQLIVRVVEDI
ncbi:hypothetical protein GCM10009565_51950 [Amycolatopsis albidoflavus]